MVRIREERRWSAVRDVAGGGCEVAAAAAVVHREGPDLRHRGSERRPEVRSVVRSATSVELGGRWLLDGVCSVRENIRWLQNEARRVAHDAHCVSVEWRGIVV